MLIIDPTGYVIGCSAYNHSCIADRQGGYGGPGWGTDKQGEVWSFSVNRTAALMMPCTSGIRPTMVAMPFGNNTTAVGFMSLYYMFTARRVGKGSIACKQAGHHQNADKEKIWKMFDY
jgi:hypothetical protein